MKSNAAEPIDRRIASREHNYYIDNGIDPHSPTEAVPNSFLKPLGLELRGKISKKQRDLEVRLDPLIGKPFYSDEGFLLYNNDCCEVLRKLSGFALDLNLSVTSPPYNIGKVYEEARTIEKYIGWCSDWMTRIYEITNPNGSFWLNLGYFEVPNKGLCVPIPYLLWDKSPFFLNQEVVWKYGAGVSAKRRLSPRNEKWLFYVKDQNSYTFDLDSIRDPNVKYPNQKKNGKFRCNPLGKNPSDVWEFPKVTTGENRSSRERTAHPAQFPLGIVERIVLVSSKPLDLVLDPFAGSSSTGIAAAALGRLFIGIELKTEYCKMATERYKKFKAMRDVKQNQMTIFNSFEES